MDDEHKEELTPEEKESEEEALKEVKDDDLRSSLAERYGLDPDEESELLDKIVEDKLADRKKLSGAIKQKRNWRERAESTSKKDPEKDQGKSQGEVLTLEEIDRRFEQRMEERELKALNLSEDIETEVKDLAKVKGISVTEAAKHPYIQSRIEEAKREERVKSATPKRSNKGSYAPSFDPSKPLNPADFDFSTKEGVEAWKAAKAERAKQAQK